MKWDGYCMSCKYFAQGKTCSFCENPNQKDPDYKTYVYYNYSCGLYTKGISESRVKYMESLKTKKV